MEYKIFKKIKQNTTWIDADILGINLTPNRYNALAPATVYVSNDVTIPLNSALELISISLCTSANTWMFDNVYIKGNQMKLFK